MLLPRLFLAAAGALAITHFVSAQGALTPGGAPAPQGKTLSQLEPRTDVATLPSDANAMFVISQRGSYFLSGNLTVTGARVGIAIAANDVTLDLNGFTITGNATAPAGIDFRGLLSGARVFNGHLVSFPAGPGVRASGGGVNRISQAAFEDLGIRACSKGFDLDPVHDVRVERARVSSCTAGGIDLNSRGTVVNCLVQGIVGGAASVIGIDADVVIDSQVADLSGSPVIGIDAAQVTNCRARNVGDASSSSTTGIQGTLTRGCVLESITGISVIGISGSEVTECRVSSLAQRGGSGSSLARGISATIILDCSVSSLTAENSTELTGFASYEQAIRCRVGSVPSSPGGAAGFRPAGSSSQTIDSGASSVGLNIGVDLDGSTGAVIRGCRFNLAGAGIGISCSGTNIRIEDNTITGAAVGINAGSSSTSGLIVRNRVTNCTLPIVFNATTWQVGPRLSAVGDISSTNPWANFID